MSLRKHACILISNAQGKHLTYKIQCKKCSYRACSEILLIWQLLLWNFLKSCFLTDQLHHIQPGDTSKLARMTCVCYQKGQNWLIVNLKTLNLSKSHLAWLITSPRIPHKPRIGNSRPGDSLGEWWNICINFSFYVVCLFVWCTVWMAWPNFHSQ